ncbi:hypothetical protein [Amycolatopsis rifamycinica]|uniref:Uncharacterized protein n=1 Tax=Amycolatopsis rifamycinica TaxID=287986 RepID=A0A066UCF4_9PSEU|nr:hypothetical protein [Amycolatopsis rifamycinica]KDN21913.1 hypothetical protein DV20_13435 [Amycolatopsis rifamycinica]
MTENPHADRGNRARRREERRARPTPPPAAAPARPANLSRAFVVWMVLGVLTAVAIIGIIIVLAAVNLRAGYRGARVVLTVIGAGSFLSLPVIVGGVLWSGGSGAVALIPLGLSSAMIAAVVLMWRPDVTAWFRARRQETAPRQASTR